MFGVGFFPDLVELSRENIELKKQLERIMQNPGIFGSETNASSGTPNLDSSAKMAATITKLKKELTEAQKELATLKKKLEEEKTQSARREGYFKSEKHILESRITSLQETLGDLDAKAREAGRFKSENE